MLPDREALLAGYTLYAKQNRFTPDRDAARLAEALREAGAFADGHEEDEPAALFFALTRRPRIVAKAHGRITLHLTAPHARALGLAFTAAVAVLKLMRAWILRGAIAFEDLRAWFSAHLAPIPRTPWPPR